MNGEKRRKKKDEQEEQAKEPTAIAISKSAIIRKILVIKKSKRKLR